MDEPDVVETISEDELRERVLKHSRECKECTFVANAECIVVTKEQIEKCTLTSIEIMKSIFKSTVFEDKIVELGYFSLSGWSGHLMFYLFYCTDCNHISFDYIHGLGGYLTCQNQECGINIQLKGKRFFKT